MQDKRKLGAWMKRSLFNTRAGERCRKLQIRHITSAGKVGTEVATIEIEAGSLSQDSYIDTLTSEIEMACYDDAEGIGGVQKYVIIPHYGEKLEAAGRFILRVAAGDDTEDGGEIDSEPATKNGLVSQLMRHNEALMRTAVASTGQIIQLQNRVIARQQEHIETMMGKHFDTTVELEGLVSQRHERDLATKRAAFKIEQTKEIVGKVTQLLPVVVNKIAGKKVMPEKVTPKDVMIRELMGSLTTEQMNTVASALKPEQMILLSEIYQGEASEHGKEQEEKAKKEAEEKANESTGSG